MLDRTCVTKKNWFCMLIRQSSVHSYDYNFHYKFTIYMHTSDVTLHWSWCKACARVASMVAEEHALALLQPLVLLLAVVPLLAPRLPETLQTSCFQDIWSPANVIAPISQGSKAS